MAEAAPLLLLAAFAAPCALPLERVNPAAAGAVWLAVLALRALVVVGLALSALLLLPATHLFHRVTGWSGPEVLGWVGVDLSGEPIAHGAALGPAALLVLSLLVFALTLLRGAVALRSELRRRTLGRGPLGSVVIADRSPVVAIPGVGRARIILSAPALAALDEAELEACLAHEVAHLRRRHRLFGLVGACLAVVARPVPGARAAERGLRLSLERDADEHAVCTTGDPLALASAICKLAGAPASTFGRGPLAFALDGAGAARARLDGLLAGGRSRAGAGLERLALLLGVCLPLVVTGLAVAFALWLAAATPPSALTAALTCHG
jgi:Zn-dependent protease with chaperone function